MLHSKWGVPLNVHSLRCCCFFESKKILLPVETKRKYDFMIIITILFTFQVNQEEMTQLEVWFRSRLLYMYFYTWLPCNRTFSHSCSAIDPRTVFHWWKTVVLQILTMETKIKLMLGQVISLFSIPGVIIDCCILFLWLLSLHVYLLKQFSVSFKVSTQWGDWSHKFKLAWIRGLVAGSKDGHCD